MDKITQALQGLFQKHRIVFWYDTKRELRENFEAMDLAQVEKIEIAKNEYGVKYRILREQPQQKFLLYHDGPAPDELNNWLLDVLLAHGEFRADKVSLWLTELQLGPEFWTLVQEHEAFFQAKARLNALKQRLEKDDSHRIVRLKMLAVCTSSDADADLEEILEQLLEECSRESEEKFNLITRCRLDTFLWNQLEQTYGYVSELPGIYDFAIELFKSSYALSLGEEAALLKDGLIFLKRWKDSNRFQPAFNELSDRIDKVLHIEEDLATRELENLIEIDFFKNVDLRILGELAQRVSERTISEADCANIVWHRRGTHWYKHFLNIYEAISFGSQFLAALELADLKVESLLDGVKKYVNHWHRMDQLYRKFVFHVRACKQVTLLENLVSQVESNYSNRFLLKLNDGMQTYVDGVETWGEPDVILQSDFYTHWVQAYLKDQVKIAVVISDALRYEVGEELLSKICSEDRFSAELEPMLGMLPSYTQLGMGSLLPHDEIEIEANGSVKLDGKSSAGTENRAKILGEKIAGGATALRASDLMSMTRDESRTLIKDHQVVYIYHNQIDAIGDKRESEERVFEAVETALIDLVDIVKKLANANLSNILITADHGFIYQDRPIDESEYAGVDVKGEQILYRDRRFVIGQNLEPSPSVKIFSADGLGLVGDYQVAIPKSINRLRLSGAGSRYVHGGASLQEIVLPVIKVNKKRVSDVVQVEVDILRSASDVITSGQLSVAFYQVDPASSKVQERRLRAGIYAKNGELISDRHELTFDLSSEDAREREVPLQFVLTQKANEFNNQEVLLKLEEQVPRTTHYQLYKSVRYLLRRSFTTDFEL